MSLDPFNAILVMLVVMFLGLLAFSAHVEVQRHKTRLASARFNGSCLRMAGRQADANPWQPNGNEGDLALANAWLAGWLETDRALRDLERKGGADV